MKINEREVATYALLEILYEGGYSNLVIRQTLNRHNGMTREQKAFVTEMVYGCMKNLLLIDAMIGAYSKTPLSKMRPLIACILRTAVYELHWMRSPSYAVVHEAVQLTRKKKFANLTGFVNGVLRNIERNGAAITMPDKEKEPVQYLSLAYSHPEWLVKRWMAEYGREQTEEICRVNQSVPVVSICVNPLRTSREELTEQLRQEGVLVDEGQTPYSLYLAKTSDLTQLASFRDGLFHIMDESSIHAVCMAAPQKGERVVDVCAAPGGKSFLAAYLMEDQGVILARDCWEHKINLLLDGVERLGLQSIQPELFDGSQVDKHEREQVDCVLLDAPCSGLGLCRKKPDIKYSKTEEDITNLQQVQREMLAAASQMVKPGGRLLYSTCTLTKEENQDNSRWLTANFPFEMEKEQLIFPSSHGDGFYMARMRKKSE